MENHWKKIAAETVSDIIDVDVLSTGSQALLTPEMRPETYIRELVRAEKWLDAANVMAHALPRREAVWWACLCAKKTKKPPPESNERSALSAAVKWVYKPTDENRQEAFRLAQVGDPESPGTLAALAAAYSSEVLPLPGEQHVDVDKAVFPKIVFAIVVMAANEAGKDQIDGRLQSFLLSGEEIAQGGTGKIKRKQG
jgi:hypothetical protein